MRKHAFDPASFVLGLVIAGVAVAYLVAEAQDRTVDGAWVLPLTLIGLGVAAVAAGLNRAFRRTPAPVAVDATLAPSVVAEPAPPTAAEAATGDPETTDPETTNTETTDTETTEPAETRPVGSEEEPPRDSP